MVEDLLEKALAEKKVTPKVYSILKKFAPTYFEAALQNGYSRAQVEPIIAQFFKLTFEEISKPSHFEPYHQGIRAPFDYYQFGIDFIRPLIKKEASRVEGKKNLDDILKRLKAQENVILFANHQIEPDPQILCILLEEYPELLSNLVIVAGQRVVTDPMAIPFSKGLNLLCVYSKKYIEHPPEEKEQKQLHNQRTMKQMSQLLNEGGKCIYVAPSGGRDRIDAKGFVDVAKFDSSSVELFYLIGSHASQNTSFFPLAMATYDLLPPPQSVQKELGERRQAQSAPVHIAFGERLEMENFPGVDALDKKHKRKARADYIWNQVRQDYLRIYHEI